MFVVSESKDGVRSPSASWSGSTSNSVRGRSGQGPQDGAFPNESLHSEHRKPSIDRTRTRKLYDLDPVTTDKQYPMNSSGQLHLQHSHAREIAIQDTTDSNVHSDDALFDHEDSNPSGTFDNCAQNKDVPVFHEVDDIANQRNHFMGAGEIDSDHGHTQPLRPFDGNRQARNNQILRKVNSNFQILRPGTLDAPRPSHDHSEWQVDLEAANKRSSRKLQKRGRASSKSSYTLE